MFPHFRLTLGGQPLHNVKQDVYLHSASGPSSAILLFSSRAQQWSENQTVNLQCTLSVTALSFANTKIGLARNSFSKAECLISVRHTEPIQFLHFLLPLPQVYRSYLHSVPQPGVLAFPGPSSVSSQTSFRCSDLGVTSTMDSRLKRHL